MAIPILGRSTTNPLGSVWDQVLVAPQEAPKQKKREKPSEWVLLFEDSSIHEQAEVGGCTHICRGSSPSKETNRFSVASTNSYSEGHKRREEIGPRRRKEQNKISLGWLEKPA